MDRRAGERLRLVCALAALVGAVAPRPASAQIPPLTLHTRLVFYGDDTEFSNQFRPGETIVGTYALAFLDAAIGDRLIVRAGGFGNWRLGSEQPIDQGHPVLALIVSHGPQQFIFGTLETMRHVRGDGPDRTGPHGLLPPMQQETLSFTRPYESGLQWTVDSPRYTHDAWMNWQRMNTRVHREIFDTGMATLTRLQPAVAIRGDVHFYHRGGQQGGVEPVTDSVSAAAGVELGGPVGDKNHVTLELIALGSRYVPDRQQPQLTMGGFATFLRLSVEHDGWRVHAILWRGNGFVAIEGDPLYGSIRHDGTRWLPLRDYAEVGASRKFILAENAFLETSLRLHRAEDNYEISFRILGVANLKMPVHK
jgi:hypothetical protein